MGRYAACLTRLMAILYKLWRSEVFFSPPTAARMSRWMSRMLYTYCSWSYCNNLEYCYNVEFEDQRKNRKPKRFWVRPWLSARKRLELGHYHRLMRELNMEDTISFFNNLRMQTAMFDEILNRVGPRIQKKDTNTFAIINAFAAFMPHCC